MNPFTTKSDPLINAASAILAEAANNAMTALDLRKKYGGAYVSSMDFKEYSEEPKFVNAIKEFMRKNKLSPKETAVFHEEGFAKYESFPAMLRLLDKKNIVYTDFKDRTSAGVIVFSLKPVVSEEVDLQERKINGVTAKTASEADRKKGESYSVYDKKTKKIVVGGITRASAKEIVDSDPDTYASGSSEWVADHLKEDLDEAVYGTNTPARKIAQAKSDIKEYKRNLKDAIADKKDPDTIKHWQKRIDASTKELADLMKNESVELEEGITHSRGFQQVAEKLDDIRGILSPNGILSKSISKQLGVGYIKDFKKISEMLADVEDAWDEIRKDLAMDEDRINN